MFVLAWRNLLRNKSFSFLNIAGLSIGIAAFCLILLWLSFELSYDKFHTNINRIYEVYNRDNNNGSISVWNVTPTIMAPTLQNESPEIEHTARVNWSTPSLFIWKDVKIKANGNIVDSTFLDIFSYPLLYGKKELALKGMYSVVITESLAKKIFGRVDVLGEIVNLDNNDNFTITAIIKDLPHNTKFNFEYLIPWTYMIPAGWNKENWNNNNTTSYVLLKDHTVLSDVQKKIKNIRKTHDKDSPNLETFFYPFKRSYLYANFDNGIEHGGRIDLIRIFGIIAGIILLNACINYMNLSTARSAKRAREIGVRKVIGAKRRWLIIQFFCESLLITFLALILGIILVYISIPTFNELIGKELILDFSNKWMWVTGLVVLLITGIFAGSYPALHLSSLHPVAAIKGGIKNEGKYFSIRKILVVLQFTFAIAFIIATIIVKSQLNYAQSREKGFDQNNLVYYMMEGEADKNFTLIKNDLLSSGYVSSVTKTNSPITEGWSNSWGMTWEGKPENERTVIDRFCADDAFVKTAGAQLVSGRDFDLKNFPSDSSALLINETSLKLMAFKDPIGKIIHDNERDWHVIGVIKDFILRSPFSPVDPIIIQGASGWFNVIHMRLNPNLPLKKAITTIEGIIKKHNPDYPVTITFVDQAHAQKFENIKRTERLASYFSVLSIFISCLGLFGLTGYMVENRKKEIGIRKVLGSSVSAIIQLFTREFITLVLIAFIIACPIAYLGLNKWLQSFFYRISFEWWVFVLSLSIVLLITVLTVGFQSFNAARVKPTQSLKTE